LHLKGQIEFTTFTGVGKNPTGTMSRVGPTGLRSEHCKAQIASASASVPHWPIGIALFPSTSQNRNEGCEKAEGQEESKGSA
jgi:hypothetical protein